MQSRTTAGRTGSSGSIRACRTRATSDDAAARAPVYRRYSFVTQSRTKASRTRTSKRLASRTKTSKRQAAGGRVARPLREIQRLLDGADQVLDLHRVGPKLLRQLVQ